MRIFDTLTNLVANLGVGTSKAASDSFGLRQLSDQELEAMYRADWISRKVIDLPVADMLRPWRAWQAEKELITAIEDAEKRHQIRAKLALAMWWARLYGGSAILIGADVGQPMAPLRVEAVGQGGLRYLTVLPRRLLQAGELDYDPQSPHYGEPKYYRLVSRTGTNVEVHPSRVMRFLGPPRPDIDTNPEGWGDSILQVVYDAIHNAALSQGAIAELVHEAKVDVIKVANMGAMLATQEGTALLTKRFTNSNMLKSINNTLLIDKEEEWERKEVTFTGVSDVLMNFLQVVSGACDIPITRFIGTSPKGMNATGESDLRNYYDMLDGKRTDDLRPKLEFLDQILWRDALGAVPKDAYFTFNPLWQMTAKEKADIGKTKAETTQIYANMGLIPDEPLAVGVVNMLIEDETYPGLEAEIEKYLASNPQLVPPDEMEALEVERAEAEIQSIRNGSKGKPPTADRLATYRALTGPGPGLDRHAQLARELADELDARERLTGGGR